MAETETLKNILDQVYFENMMLKLFLMENNLTGDFAEFINEKNIQFKTFENKTEVN